MKRRKSRQSCNTFVNVDIDYIGNAGAYQHIFKNGPSHPNQASLNFKMKLRNYKNNTDFVAE